jgi:alpha-galactosidase
MMILILVIILIFIFNFSNQQYMDVTKPGPYAPTPPMGWNSWDCFKTDIDEYKIKGIVYSLVNKGLHRKGYRYIILDDGWMDTERDMYGRLQGDRYKFPNGIKYLSHFIHSYTDPKTGECAGLKFGIYTSVGRNTCEGLPGSYDNEYTDALTFAEWEVDYVKVDWCTYKHTWWPFWNYRYRYQLMSDAIQGTGRDIVIAMCNWGFGNSHEWGRDIAHTWRIAGDIEPTHESIDKILEKGKSLARFNRPNEWNDLDTLQVGNGIPGYLARKQFYWWCRLKAPLILGCDIRYLKSYDYKIITNDKLISMNQSTDEWRTDAEDDMQYFPDDKEY